MSRNKALIKPNAYSSQKFYKTQLENYQSQVHFQDPYDLLKLAHIPFRIEDLHSLCIRYNQEACLSQVKRIHCLEVLCFLEIRKYFIKTPLCKRPSAIYILTWFGKKRYRVGKFSTRLPISVRSFAFFKHTQMIHAGCVKVAPGKPHTGRVKLKISPDAREAKFSVAERKKSTELGFIRSVKEECKRNFTLCWDFSIKRE